MVVNVNLINTIIIINSTAYDFCQWKHYPTILTYWIVKQIIILKFSFNLFLLKLLYLIHYIRIVQKK